MPSPFRGRETTEGPADDEINSRLGVTHLPELVSPRNRNRVHTCHPGGGTDVSTIYRDCTTVKETLVSKMLARSLTESVCVVTATL
jgi:hypothetical protein